MKIFDRVRQKYFPNTLVRVTPRPLSFYVGLMAQGRPFSFSRFGDGEWNAILGSTGENCDGHPYFPELGADLRGALTARPAYFCAMQYRAIRDMGTRMRAFLDVNGVSLDWHDADVFHAASNEAELFPLVNQLRAMKVVVVGPPHLRGMDRTLFHYAQFIEIPPKNCYHARHEIEAQVRRCASSLGPALFSFSASMTSNVLIHRLYPDLGATSWLVDFGSLWDVFVGVLSRGGTASEERLRKNTGRTA
jgi:hypothetical protein